jgi:ABC-type multidrug transport system fused ATPase/permease subunit
VRGYGECFLLVASSRAQKQQVRFNILLGALKPEAEVTQGEIEHACRDANILEFIESLPRYCPNSDRVDGAHVS